MKYMGSKNKISMQIKEIIDLNRDQDQAYYEPMCGGCNMIDKMRGKRFASDNNKYLIAMWKGLQQELYRPHNISKEMYLNAKSDFKNVSSVYYSDFLIGWIGFMASFNGKFFNGYASNDNRDYIKESINNIEIQVKLLKDVEFKLADYSRIYYIPKSVIYLDIPYKGTTEYKTGSFDHDKLYCFAEEKSKEGQTVFISEYWMPEDRFTKIWSESVNCGMNAGNSQRKIESLFIPKGQKTLQQQKLF